MCYNIILLIFSWLSDIFIKLRKIFRRNLLKVYQCARKIYNFETETTKQHNTTLIQTHITMASTKIQTNLMNLQGNMLNFAYMLTNNREDAYDLLQDTTLKVLANAEKYDESTNFKGWVFTIMRNIFINDFSRNQHVTAIVDTSDNLFALGLSDSLTETPEGCYTVAEVNVVLQRLPSTLREPFFMHLAGYMYQEIADHLALSLAVVRNRVSSACRKLHARLGAR